MDYLFSSYLAQQLTEEH